MKEQHLRVARATNDLEVIVRLYRDGLGFDLIGSFENHEGYDGAMLGRPGAPYHLEFTQEEGCEVAGAPSEENLLVFYLPEEEVWLAACEKAERAGFTRVKSHNPYWEVRGRTFEDPDGYRVAFENSEWELC